MRTGGIVLIPFPFSEINNVKIRPAVVIAETKDKYKDIILSAVSSQIPALLSSAEILIKPDSLNGLRVASVIKVDRIFTLKTEKIITKLGRLSLKNTNEFCRVFRELVD